MAKKVGGLGKGLDVLFMQNTMEDGVSSVTLPLEEIVPNRQRASPPIRIQTRLSAWME